MKEWSVGEQRYKAVMAVLSDGRTVTEVARDWEVSRQTMHAWLARYEREGLEGMGDRSHRPTRCPHQMPALIEVRVLEMRRYKPFWGPRRLSLELAKKGVIPTPSASAIYRCLLRAGLIQPVPRRWRREDWKRWERGAAMELWQLDVVGGFHLADGTTAKALTGLDDHSRFGIAARLMHRERTSKVCEGFSVALRKYGVPDQVLTDNGKVFTGRFAQPRGRWCLTGSAERTVSSTSSPSRARRPPPERSNGSTRRFGWSSTPGKSSRTSRAHRRPWTNGLSTTTPSDPIARSTTSRPRVASRL